MIAFGWHQILALDKANYDSVNFWKRLHIFWCKTRNVGIIDTPKGGVSTRKKLSAELVSICDGIYLRIFWVIFLMVSIWQRWAGNKNANLTDSFFAMKQNVHTHIGL